jgi:hypothetical protein
VVEFKLGQHCRMTLEHEIVEFVCRVDVGGINKRWSLS